MKQQQGTQDADKTYLHSDYAAPDGDALILVI